jgi:hypothetical protein
MKQFSSYEDVNLLGAYTIGFSFSVEMILLDVFHIM